MKLAINEEVRILKELLDFAVLDWQLDDELLEEEMLSITPKSKKYFKERYKEVWGYDIKL